MDNNTNGPQEILIVNDVSDFQEIYDFPEHEAQTKPTTKEEGIDDKERYKHENSFRPLFNGLATAVNSNIKLEDDGHFLTVNTGSKTDNISDNVEPNILSELYISINPLPLSTVNAFLEKASILCDDRRIGGTMKHLNNKEHPGNKNIKKKPKEQLKEKTKVLKIECDVETSETSFLEKEPLNVEADVIMDDCNIDDFSIKCEEINIKSEETFEICQFKKKKDKLSKQGQQSSCPIPNCSFFGINWKRHMLVHMDPEECTMYSCKLCDYKTKYKNHLNIHDLVHTNSWVRSFRCKQCNMQFKTAVTLKNHVKYVHFSNTSELLECFHCSAKFKAKQAIKTHIKNKHRKERHTKTYTCSECSFATPSKSNLKLHSLKHGNVERFSCSQCPFLTYERENLRKHILRSHERERMKVHKCDKCTFETIYSKNLRLHKVHIHEKSKGMPLFKCPKCGKEFKYKSGMTAHMPLHSNAAEDILQCANCHFKTRHKKILKRHIKLKHLAKQFKCNQCEFVTTKISVFKSHVACHEGNEECYVCDSCHYRCKKKQSLKYHIDKCHA